MSDFIPDSDSTSRNNHGYIYADNYLTEGAENNEFGHDHLLQAVSMLLSDAERLLADRVNDAHQGGLTWQQIGDALNLSRQAVNARFRKHDSI